MTAQDDKRDRWMADAEGALREAMLSPSLTDLDRLLMRGQFTRLQQGVRVAFPDKADKTTKTLRSARLKLLGYRWDAKDRSWAKYAEP